MADQKTCFVVMGFNKKTDYATGRTLDLNKTYRNIIKPAVEAAGVKCLRADEIIHSGVIDVPMYEQLLEADLVVADISTMNANAIYELGVRHALRPATTIVMGESRIFEKGYPFDLNHLLIRSYVHMGDGIDFDEVEAKRKELTEAIQTILAAPKHDSPVYTSLADLERPQRRVVLKQIAEAVAAVAPALPAVASGDAYCVLLDNAEAALRSSDFDLALRSFRAARELNPKDAHVVQRTALATYKSGKPDVVAALREARTILKDLDPETSNDPETLGLWGAVHKRLFEETQDDAALDRAAFAYEKGFYLRNDYYNGINLAFLLNLRAKRGHPAEAIADFIDAQRTRRRVAALCEPLCAGDPPSKGPALDAYYWVKATLAEALVGTPRHAELLAQAYALDVAQWMKKSTADQLAKLEPLLADSPLKYLANAGG